VTRLYFILRGDNEPLARGELRALLEVFGVNTNIECYTMICTTAHTSSADIAGEIMSRAGYIREAGVLIGVFDAYSEKSAVEVSRIISNGRVHVSVFKSTVSDRVVKSFIETGGLKHGSNVEYRLLFSNGLVFLGLVKHRASYKQLELRARGKPFKRSIELTPELARVLINLSRARKGDLLLDPFAGTGVVLIEAWSMGIRGIGVDVDSIIARGMRENISYFSANSIVLLGDSRALTYKNIDHVVTDLPYGRGASTHRVAVKTLYREFLDKLAEYLTRNGYAVFMTPHWLEEYVDEILPEYGLKITERYYDYVHSSLTRVINVARLI